jgi:hypothetical protein
MTSNEFIVWLTGFTEACNDFHPTPKQWDRIKEVLNEIQDYNDNPGIDDEIDNCYYIKEIPLNGTIPVTGSGISANNFSTSSNGTSISTTMVWNDKIGNWHYTNYPEGFGYYINSTLENKKKENE